MSPVNKIDKEIRDKTLHLDRLFIIFLVTCSPPFYCSVLEPESEARKFKIHKSAQDMTHNECLSDCLSACLSASLTVYLPVWASVCLSVCLSACLGVCLSVSVSVSSFFPNCVTPLSPFSIFTAFSAYLFNNAFSFKKNLTYKLCNFQPYCIVSDYLPLSPVVLWDRDYEGLMVFMRLK